MRGNCYVAAEALYHIMGGKADGWNVMRVRVPGDTHWYLQHDSGVIVDPSRCQFRKLPPYEKGKRAAFLTKQPSRRARALMDTLTWQ